MFSGKLAIPLQGDVTNQRLWLYEVYLYLHALAAASFLGPFLVPSTNIYTTKVPHQYYVLHCTNIFLDPFDAHSRSTTRRQHNNFIFEFAKHQC